MKTLDFCGGWQVAYLEGDIRESVTLPHDAMLREKRTQGSAGDVHIGWFEGHDYEYVKCFDASDFPRWTGYVWYMDLIRLTSVLFRQTIMASLI